VCFASVCLEWILEDTDSTQPDPAEDQKEDNGEREQPDDVPPKLRAVWELLSAKLRPSDAQAAYSFIVARCRNGNGTAADAVRSGTILPGGGPRIEPNEPAMDRRYSLSVKSSPMPTDGAAESQTAAGAGGAGRMSHRSRRSLIRAAEAMGYAVSRTANGHLKCERPDDKPGHNDSPGGRLNHFCPDRPWRWQQGREIAIVQKTPSKPTTVQDWGTGHVEAPQFLALGWRNARLASHRGQ
jgi:hypothetical protein